MPHIKVDAATWVRLLAYTRRRARFGASGGGAGFAVALGVSWPLFGPDNAANGMLMAAPDQDGPRISPLQPHGFTDYLRQREITLEVVCGAIGLGGIVASLVLLSQPSSNPRVDRGGLILSVLATAVVASALIVQRRLLQAPVRTQEPSELVARDVILAVNLHDLVGTAVAMTASCGFAYVGGFHFSYLNVAAFLVVVVGGLRLVFNNALTARSAPVAYRLAGKGTPA